jgi:hypothetical protein
VPQSVVVQHKPEVERQTPSPQSFVVPEHLHVPPEQAFPLVVQSWQIEAEPQFLESLELS